MKILGLETSCDETGVCLIEAEKGEMRVELNISISYIKPNGRPAKYYPDIYIPKDNLIIEVKSKWTYSGKPEWLETNLLKQQATIVAGYNFKFLIY